MKYVLFNGVKHPFETEKEKKALLNQAKKTGSYTLVDGCLVRKVFSTVEMSDLMEAVKKVKDNK